MPSTDINCRRFSSFELLLLVAELPKQGHNEVRGASFTYKLTKVLDI